MPNASPNHRTLPKAAALFAAVALAAAAVHAAPGDIDLRFSGDGVLLADAGGPNERVDALLPDMDNAVFAGGQFFEVVAQPRAKGARGYDMTVLRLRGDGGYDFDWGDGGYVQIGFGGDSERVVDMVQQPDGKLVVVGSLERAAHTDFGVARIDTDGHPDNGFGELAPENKGVLRRGAIAFNMGPDDTANDEATAVALQSDGRIIVAGVGFANDGNFRYQRFAVARLTAEGQLDATFGNAGRVIAPATEFQVAEYVTAIARRRDGSLTADDGFIVAGYVDARSTAILRRYTANGTPDPQFGNNGLVILPTVAINGAPFTRITRIDDAALLDDGRIVVVGRGPDRGFAFTRLHPNGQIDTSFGTNGSTYVKFSGQSDLDEPEALTLQADGKIVGAGYATSRATGAPRTDFASVRLRSNGQPDTSYGDGAGRSSYPVSTEDDVAYAVTVTSDGSLLFAGTARVSEEFVDNDGAFLRLQGDPTIFRDGFEN